MILRPPRLGGGPLRVARGLLGRESRDDVVHVLGTLALSPLYVLPAVLFLSGVALTPLFLLGAPLLPVAMMLAGLVARAEHARHRLPPPPAPDAPTGPAAAPAWRDRMAGLFGRRAWKRLGFSAAVSLWGLGAGSVVVTLLASGALLALLPFFSPLLPAGATLLGLDATSTAVSFAACLPGLTLLAAGLRLPRHLVRAEVHLASTLLGTGTVDHLVRRVLDLEDSRSRMVDAAEDERRRIERNLHDGAQQRLLSVAMTLGRAKSRFARDPEKALMLLTAAHDDAKAAMQELRDVTRGLHPAVLQEQGLEAALLSVAARSPVPVDLRVQLTERSSPRAEAVAYYVISEALTNVAKHAAAGTATVKVLRQGDLLRVAVADDGIGGADPARGSGLRGLSDRVHAVDGHLTCTSPFGGPTVIDATIPWEA